jgi:hypothetical protein
MRTNKEIIIKTGRRKSEFTRAEIRRLIRDIFGTEKSANNKALKAPKKVKKTSTARKTKKD